MIPPRPIDPRAPRFNQAVLTVALLAGFLLDLRVVVPAFAAVLFLGAAFGPTYGPVLRVYAVIIKPRLAPPPYLEDPRPPRFAATVGVCFLSVATLAFVAGAPGLAWGLSLIVAALAARTSLDLPVLPDCLRGPGRTWVVFSTEFCATCGPVAARLRFLHPDDTVRTVMVEGEAALTDTYAVRTAPTLLEVDRDGNVVHSVAGAEPVLRYVGALADA